jgi:hypothetical protein
MTLFATMPPRLYVTCPACDSPHALVTLERTSSQACFCPGCRHLWTMPLTRTREAKPSRDGPHA